MTETVSIVIGTYGDLAIWKPLADRAFASAENQTVEPKNIVWYHGKTLQDARNWGAHSAKGDWLVFLDADDTLDRHYIEGILAGEGDLRQPMTLGVHPDGHEDPYPVLIPRKQSLLHGNWLVIGTGIRREHFVQVGGFGDEPFWEDWVLWLKLTILAGATIGTAPKAIYRIGVHIDGRNNAPQRMQSHSLGEISNYWRVEASKRGVRI